jgi:hypothetical protein
MNDTPKCNRLTIMAVFDDGSSRLIDFRDPVKIETEETETLDFSDTSPGDELLRLAGAYQKVNSVFTLTVLPVNQIARRIDIVVPVPE